jgi:phosphoribosylanthranilate isomerase
MKALKPESEFSPEERTEALSSGDFIIKVCGITSLEDALISVELGANALGFNFYPRSPRFIDLEDAGRICEKLPEDVLKVGLVVFQSQSPASDCVESTGSVSSGSLRTLIGLGLDAFQFHGLREPGQIPDVGKRVFIATSPELAGRFPLNEIIIDTSWGSGTRADWDLLKRTVRVPYVLSGGLTPGNVSEALSRLDPVGVDVCSGVELAPGKKDPDKLRLFLGVVRGYVSRSDTGSQKD